jgi:hypothetical protein
MTFFRLDETKTDDDLCWLEKSLVETTIEIPSKAPSSSESDKEPIATDPEVAQIEEEASPSSPHTESLSNLLPANTFAQISPRCYVFPGAEVTLENMEGDSEDSDDDFSDEDEEEENEITSANANEIIVPDIDNALSVVPVPEVSPTPTTSSSLSPTPLSSSQLQCNDRETVENIIDIQANDATEDLEPAPMKRPRLENEAEKVF